jgi:hypothetical protein
LLQKQLDADLESGKIANEAAQIVANSLSENIPLEATEMGKILLGSSEANLGALAKEDWASDL